MAAEEATVEVRGRMLLDPRVKITADHRCVMIDVDDGLNQEFWLHLEMTTERLIYMLEMIAAQHPFSDATTREAFARLRADMIV